MTRDDLQAFTAEIADAFNRGEIRAPVHLSDGNEDALIEVFRDIKPDDWCLGGWRFHYQCLLHGVPRDTLKAAILAGESMHLAFPQHRILCSSIVGGILPIAVGIALGIQRRGGTNAVRCWMGDMTFATGIAHECMRYARNHDLPLVWYIEDNGVSVLTPTGEAWGRERSWPEGLHRYAFKSRYPHSGTGQFVAF